MKLFKKIQEHFDRLEDKKADKIQNEFQRRCFKSYLENRRRQDSKSLGNSQESYELKEALIAGLVALALIATLGVFILFEVLTKS